MTVKPFPMEDDGQEVAMAAGATVSAVVLLLSRRKRRRSLEQWRVVLALEDEIDDENDDHVKRPRNVYVRPDYTQSAWAVMLRTEELNDPSSREFKAFRRRFRLPYSVFNALGTSRERICRGNRPAY